MTMDIAARFDAVVMLTESDWFTEPISNRYHYATRFAKHLPVYFVQLDSPAWEYTFEETKTDNVTVLHLPRCAKKEQFQCLILLERALLQRQVMRPLLWAYVWQYESWMAEKNAPLKIFHATEDYAVTYRNDADKMKRICMTLHAVDGMVAVCQSVLNNYGAACGFDQAARVLTNGCDYAFWGLAAEEKQEIFARGCNRRMLYEGGVNYRLDFALLCGLARRLPDWEILLCGRCCLTQAEEGMLAGQPNIKVLGEMPIEQVRALCLNADVGLIPFVEKESLYNSFPLKAFEYLATGLPVVSTDILALQPYADVIDIAMGADGFASAVLAAKDRRRDPAFVERCLLYAKQKDYDKRFAELLAFLSEIPDYARGRQPHTVHVLYDRNFDMESNHALLNALLQHSIHTVDCLPADAQGAAAWKTSDTVAVLVGDKPFPELSSALQQRVKRFTGNKILLMSAGQNARDERQNGWQRFGIRETYAFEAIAAEESIARFDAYIDAVGYSYANNRINRYFDRLAALPEDERGARKRRQVTFWFSILRYSGLRQAYKRFTPQWGPRLIQALRNRRYRHHLQ